MPNPRTPEQKAARAAAERARRLAKKASGAGEVIAARDAEESAATAVIAAAVHAATRPTLTVVPDPPKAGKPASYLKAVAAKKLGKRGPGRKVTDAEMTAVARRLAADTFCTMRQAMEIAYWLERIALTPARWEKAWTAAQTASSEAV